MKNFDLRIVNSEDLRSSHIEALIKDEILAVRIPNFYILDECENLGTKILESQKIEKYTHEQVEDGILVQRCYGVDRIGVPFNSTYGYSETSEQRKYYYSNVQKSEDILRALAYPSQSPADKLRLELSRKFINNAAVASFEESPMLAGITRITRPNLSNLSSEQPHFDALPQRYAKLDSQLAANIYIKVPETGGELEIWDVPPMDPLFSPPKNWRAHLPSSVFISPEKGELIIFNCRKPHAIGTFEGEPRISIQMFIGYQKDRPLQLWN